MGYFTIVDFVDFEDPNYLDLWPGLEWTKDNFGWWCLGHNFDVVATILAMSHLSWQKGFDAGLAIADFADRPTWAGPNSVEKHYRHDHARAEYLKSVQLGSHPTD